MCLYRAYYWDCFYLDSAVSTLQHVCGGGKSLHESVLGCPKTSSFWNLERAAEHHKEGGHSNLYGLLLTATARDISCAVDRTAIHTT